MIVFSGYAGFRLCCCSSPVQNYFCISVRVRNKAEAAGFCFRYIHLPSPVCSPISKHIHILFDVEEWVWEMEIRTASHGHRWVLIRQQRDREADRQNKTSTSKWASSCCALPPPLPLPLHVTPHFSSLCLYTSFVFAHIAVIPPPAVAAKAPDAVTVSASLYTISDLSSALLLSSYSKLNSPSEWLYLWAGQL